MMSSDESMNLGSDLCRECGLCCDGTVFDRVDASEDESAETLVSIGLTNIAASSKGIIGFTQPCPQFSGCCSIYEQRPHICRKFRCALLKAVDQGKRTVEAAILIVSDIKTLRNNLEPHLDDSRYCGVGGTPVSLIKRAKQLLIDRIRSSNGDAKTSGGKHLAEAFSFLALVERHLIPPKVESVHQSQPHA